MSGSDKKCCVPGCTDNDGKHQVLHIFPNPLKDKDRFETWIKCIGGNILGLDDAHIYKYRRVCHVHFEAKYLCRYNRISKDAIPTINILAPVALPNFTSMEQSPLTPNENYPSTSKQKLGILSLPHDPAVLVKPKSMDRRPLKQIENIPSKSKGSESRIEMVDKNVTVVYEKQVAMMCSRSVLLKKLTTPSQLNLYHKLIRTRVKLSKFRSKVKKQAATLKAAKNLLSHPKFVQIMENVPAAAKVLTLMQFREHKKKLKGHRFTNEEKVLALSILKQSPKGYRFLRKLLILPAPQTLSKLVNKANIKPGINAKVFYQLKKKADKMKLEERLCVVMFDEVSLKAHLTFNERKDEVIGFATDGQVKKKDFADHAQVFMVRGLLKNYKQPVSYTFSTAATKGPELAKQLRNVIEELQKTGLIVVATICDQGSNNRQAIKLLLQETHGLYLRKGKEPKHNVILINDQLVVPLYDPPHLLKCVRNNLVTKDLKYCLNDVNGTAKWSHLELLLKENPGYKGIRLIPKLTDKHILTNQIPKMKVKYASQVFSQAVANNMGYLADKKILPQDCKETADLLLFFDRLFDSFNGSYIKKNMHGKPLLSSAKPNSLHHYVWNEAKKTLKTMKFVNKRNGKVESVPTLNNWVWTIDGVQTLLKNLQNRYGVTSVWMRHLNQDPIENFFGAIRSHGCRNNNPTPENFESAYTALLINNLSSVHAPGGNCEKDLCTTLYALVITEDCEDSSTCDIPDIPDINLVPLEEKVDPRISGPLNYVSGYFVHQLKKKIFKSCKQCKKDLLSKDEVEYIKYREYAGRRWLCSPSEAMVKFLCNLQDIYHTVLKKYIIIKNIKEFVKTLIFMTLDFEFIKCKRHKDDVINFMINLSCRFFVHNYCKNVNKILSGRKTCDDDEDELQLNAKKYFHKCLKRKC